MIEEPADAPATVSCPSRARRLFAGWFANLFQVIVGVTQQVGLVRVFLHFWTLRRSGRMARHVIYAAGNLVLIADCGLHSRVINRFLAFKSMSTAMAGAAVFYAAGKA